MSYNLHEDNNLHDGNNLHNGITWHPEQLAHVRDRLPAVALHRRLILAVETYIAQVEQPRDQTEELLPRCRRDVAEIARAFSAREWRLQMRTRGHVGPPQQQHGRHNNSSACCAPALTPIASRLAHIDLNTAASSHPSAVYTPNEISPRSRRDLAEITRRRRPTHRRCTHLMR